MKTKKITIILAVVSLFATAFATALFKGGSMPTDKEKDCFDWSANAAEVWNRLPETPYRPPEDKVCRNLMLVLDPECPDPKLKESAFAITVHDFIGEYCIFKGNYEDTIRIETAPCRSNIVFVSFWAFHEKTDTLMSWRSKNSCELFVGKPLKVKLFNGYNEQADAWFQIIPME